MNKISKCLLFFVPLAACLPALSSIARVLESRMPSRPLSQREMLAEAERRFQARITARFARDAHEKKGFEDFKQSDEGMLLQKKFSHLRELERKADLSAVWVSDFMIDLQRLRRDCEKDRDRLMRRFLLTTPRHGEDLASWYNRAHPIDPEFPNVLRRAQAQMALIG